MRYNLNAILDAAKPVLDGVTFTFDGTDYNLRRLTVADWSAIENGTKARAGESADDRAVRIAALARGLFDGDAPPMLSVDVSTLTPDQRVDALTDSMNVLRAITFQFGEEYSGPKVDARIRDQMRAQMVKAVSTT